MRYRIMYKDAAGEGRYQDIEANSLAHGIWTLAIAIGSQSAELVDTMALPDKENSYRVPVHVNLYPTLTVEP
jgi:hypothetical protein